MAIGKIPKKKRRIRKHAGSSSSLDSIKSKEDNTILANDQEFSQIRNVTQDSMDMRVTNAPAASAAE